MRELVERAVDLWTFGVPVVLIVWSLLRLLQGVSARARYLLVIAGFPAVLLLPSIAEVAPPTTAAAGVLPAADLFVPVVWIGGALLLLTRDAVGHLRLHRERWTDAPAELRALLDWPADVPLAIGSDAPMTIGPMTIGLLRPRVVLPAQLDFPLETMRRIAKHELAHARWRDPLVYAALRAVAAVFWMSPLWLLLRWVRREREAAADEYALRDATGAEESYVSALLRMSCGEHRPAIGMAESDLAYRARRILVRDARRASWVAMVALCAGCALAVFAQPVELEVIRDTVILSRRSAAKDPLPTARVALTARDPSPSTRLRMTDWRPARPGPSTDARDDKVVSADRVVHVHRHVHIHR
jgi:hypothetical protein